MPLKGCGGRSPQAAVAGGEISGKGTAGVFQCCKVPGQMGKASLEGMLPWSMCGIRTAVMLWNNHGPSQHASAWRRSSAQVRAWQGGWGPQP